MYHTLFLGVMCIYFHLHTSKCQNSELASHSTVRNPYTKSLSGKISFIPIKYKYSRPFGRESLIRSFFFVIIFIPFSVERYIKFYI